MAAMLVRQCRSLLTTTTWKDDKEVATRLEYKDFGGLSGPFAVLQRPLPETALVPSPEHGLILEDRPLAQSEGSGEIAQEATGERELKCFRNAMDAKEIQGRHELRMRAGKTLWALKHHERQEQPP
jgi:hypothetical protein